MTNDVTCVIPVAVSNAGDAAIAGETGAERSQLDESWKTYRTPGVFEVMRALKISVPTHELLREACKLKFAIYADQVHRTTHVNRASGEVRPDDHHLSLTLYHERHEGAHLFDRRFYIRRDHDRPQFDIVASTPDWFGQTVFYGNSMRLQMPPEDVDEFRGAVALNGCLKPWIDENDLFNNTNNMVDAVIKEIEVSTASPGQPFSDEWVPDNLAREAAYTAGRIPEDFRAWR